jgi:outer membrane protein TolC
MGAERMRRPVLLIMGIVVVAGLPARGLAQQAESAERNAPPQASPQVSPQRDFDDPRPIFKRVEPLPEVIQARPGGDEVLDLASSIDIAMQRNETVLAERERRRELDGQMNQARSIGTPTIDLYGEWSRGRDPSFALDETFGGGDMFGIPDNAPDWFQEWAAGLGSFIPEPGAIRAQSFFRADARLNWTINPVKIRGAMGAARLGTHRQDLIIEATEYATAEQVVGAYYRIIRAAAETRALEAEIANQSELLDLVRLRYELGIATTLDTLQATVTVANLEPQLRRVSKQLANEGARLNTLLGRAPEQALAIRNQQPIELEPLSTRNALGIAMGRPEIRVQMLYTEILQKNRQAQKSEQMPYLTLYGSFGYVGRTLDSTFKDGHETWRTAVGINWSIFDGLLTRGLVQQSDAQIRVAETDLSRLRRNVRVEVLETLANLDAARQNLSATKLNLDRGEQTLEEMMLMYQLGKANYLEVLVSESTRAQALSNVIEARYEVLTLTASLKRSLGYSALVSLSSISGLVGEDSP